MFPSFSVSFLFSFFSVLFLLHFEEKNAKSESVNRVSLDPVQNLCLLDENPAVSQKERGIRNWTIDDLGSRYFLYTVSSCVASNI